MRTGQNTFNSPLKWRGSIYAEFNMTGWTAVSLKLSMVHMKWVQCDCVNLYPTEVQCKYSEVIVYQWFRV